MTNRGGLVKFGADKEGKIYVIFASGGKQYKASPGETLKLDSFSGEKGEQIELDQILLVGNEDKVLVGRPFVKGAKVKATILGQGKGEKITVFKYKPKVRYRRKKGHRQSYTEVLVEEIVLPEG